MIRIPCSKLEYVRQNPVAFAQMISSSAEVSTGGSHGMFAYWQDKVRNIHKDGLTRVEGIKELEQIFLNRFATNPNNSKKQQFLLSSLFPYFDEFKKRGFEYLESRKNIKWPILSNAILTGHTPTVATCNGEYYAYYFFEQRIDWEYELRFPLIQTYLAEAHFNCNISSMHVGNYYLNENKFYLKSFSKREIDDALSETKDIFNKVVNEYNKK